MRILTIGLQSFDNAVSDKMFSEINFDEYNLVMINTMAYESEVLQAFETRQGAVRDSSLIRRAFYSVGMRLSSYVERGGDLIVVCQGAPHYYSHSGDSVDPVDYFPMEIAKVNRLKGKYVEYVGPPDVKDSLCHEDFNYFYNMVFDGNLTPLFKVPGAGNCVGGYVQLGAGGIVIFLPSVILEKVPAKAYLSKISQVPNLIRKSIGAVVDIPPWANAYKIPRESDLSDQIIEKQAAIRSLMDDLTNLEENLSQVRVRKFLFAGDGGALEEQVDWALRTIGFSISNSAEKNRVDRHGHYDGKPFVAEIKGRTKSAKEGDVAQLDKWVGEYYSSEKVEPKGLLVINAYKDTDLVNRKDQPFPNQMISYCKKRKFCLVTGL